MKIVEKLKSFFQRKENIVILFVIAIRIVLFLFFEQMKYTTDTFDYIAADGFGWMHGDLNKYRLPLYPMILDILNGLVVENYLQAVCCFQFILSCISLFFLAAIFIDLEANKKVTYMILIIYGLSEITFGWDKILLTESLSISFTVFFLYGLVKYIRKMSFAGLLTIIIFLSIGSFLKAIFIAYLAIFVAFLVIRLSLALICNKWGVKLSENNNNIKTDLLGLVMALPAIILLCMYVIGFNEQYGSYTLSMSGLGQQISVVITNEYYKSSTDEEIVNDIKRLDKRTAIRQESLLRNFFSSYFESDPLTDIEKKEISDFVNSYLEPDAVLGQKDAEMLKEYYSAMFKENLNQTGYAYFPNYVNIRKYLENNYDSERLKVFVNEAKQENIEEYLKLLWNNTINVFSSDLYPTDNQNFSFMKILYLRYDLYVLQILLFGIAEFIVFILKSIRKKKFEWIDAGLGVYITSSVIIALVGTNAEYGRTCITAIPFFFAVVDMWMSAVVDNFRNSNEERG